jgi:hypothetical protein
MNTAALYLNGRLLADGEECGIDHVPGHQFLRLGRECFGLFGELGALSLREKSSNLGEHLRVDVAWRCCRDSWSWRGSPIFRSGEQERHWVLHGDEPEKPDASYASVGIGGRTDGCYGGDGVELIDPRLWRPIDGSTRRCLGQNLLARNPGGLRRYLPPRYVHYVGWLPAPLPHGPQNPSRHALCDDARWVGGQSGKGGLIEALSVRFGPVRKASRCHYCRLYSIVAGGTRTRLLAAVLAPRGLFPKFRCVPLLAVLPHTAKHARGV